MNVTEQGKFCAHAWFFAWSSAWFSEDDDRVPLLLCGRSGSFFFFFFLRSAPCNVTSCLSAAGECADNRDGRGVAGRGKPCGVISR